MSDRPWPAGSATGLGSLPGTEPSAAVAEVLTGAPDLPYLPELPARGLGADMVGRTGSLLVDLPLEWLAGGWTITTRTGRDGRRARDFLLRDLDAMAELGAGLEVLKLQVCGPVTLAASVELPTLHKVLTDRGAFRDLTSSLAEGARRHCEDVAARLPGTRIVLQVDEPSLPAAVGGRIPTPSGYGTVRSLDAVVAIEAVTAVLAAVPSGHRVLHCCARPAPIGLLARSGADALAVDATRLAGAELDAVGEYVDGGGSAWLGVVGALDSAVSFDRARTTVLDIWSKLGFPAGSLADVVVPTPTCGLAGASADYARQAMTVLREVGRALRETAD